MNIFPLRLTTLATGTETYMGEFKTLTYICGINTHTHTHKALEQVSETFFVAS